jgi:hypothetical protein
MDTLRKVNWNQISVSCFLIIGLALSSAKAARYKNFKLDNRRFKATFRLDGVDYQGHAIFKHNKEVIFVRSANKEQTKLEVRSQCAEGLDARLDNCWPLLSVFIPEKTGSIASLKILE